MTSIYSTLATLLSNGQAASCATVIVSDAGDVLPGAKLLLPHAGTAVGSIHPDIDSQIAADATRFLLEERSQVMAYTLPCGTAAGGTVEVFIESYPTPHQLVIVGAVHVAISLAKLGKMLGYRVTVVDPRAVFATQERLPDADSIIVEWPDEAFERLTLTPSTYVAVLTHDPKLDLPALLAALNSEARYVGLIGSRATVAQRKAELEAMGATSEQLARIHAPIGLSIGARTPAEIALSVMAEMVAVRRRAGRVEGSAS